MNNRGPMGQPKVEANPAELARHVDYLLGKGEAKRPSFTAFYRRLEAVPATLRQGVLERAEVQAYAAAQVMGEGEEKPLSISAFFARIKYAPEDLRQMIYRSSKVVRFCAGKMIGKGEEKPIGIGAFFERVKQTPEDIRIRATEQPEVIQFAVDRVIGVGLAEKLSFSSVLARLNEAPSELKGLLMYDPSITEAVVERCIGSDTSGLTYMNLCERVKLIPEPMLSEAVESPRLLARARALFLPADGKPRSPTFVEARLAMAPLPLRQKLEQPAET